MNKTLKSFLIVTSFLYSSLVGKGWPSKEELFLDLAVKPIIQGGLLFAASFAGYQGNKFIATHESQKLAKKLISLPETPPINLVFDLEQQSFIDQLIFCVDNNIKFPGGSVLFYGPPGNGKSTIVNYLAHSTNSELLIINPSDLCNSSGSSSVNTSGAVAVKAIFNVAKERVKNSKKNLVIFCDELDFACLKRNEISDPQLKALCAEMLLQISAANEIPGIYIFGATNYLELLDGAMTRDGRFGNIFLMKNPSKEHIQNIYLKTFNQTQFKFSQEEISELAKKAHGLSMASIIESIKRAIISTAQIAKTPIPKNKTNLQTKLLKKFKPIHKNCFVKNLENAITLSFKNKQICNKKLVQKAKPKHSSKQKIDKEAKKKQPIIEVKTK